MQSALSHLITITRQLDRRMTDAALLQALQRMTAAKDASLLELVNVHGQHWLRRKLETDCNGLPGLPGMPLRQRRSQLLADYPALRDCISRSERVALSSGPGNTVSHWLPIWRGGDAVGCVCLTLARRLPDDLLAEVYGVLDVYANFMGLLDYSEQDSLTGLLNRKTFDQQFDDLVGTAASEEVFAELPVPERRQASSPVAHWLAVIDIDHFKEVNDQYGHLYGDEVLILMANILRQAFREQDRVFRFGGEEFVVLLRSTTLGNARNSFERLREAVEKYHFPRIDRITVSIGFVSISQPTPVTILGHADQALYFAKDHGRNQVCFYDELVTKGVLSGVSVNSEVDFF